MLNIEQFRDVIVKPALSLIQAYSDDAEELLVFTCAAESAGGTFLKQVNGEALGIYQCEPATHNDIWQNYIRHRSALANMLMLHFNIQFNIDLPYRLVYDLMYATVIARIHYMRVKEPLPSKGDIEGMWKYYKKYYNTELGKATKTKAIKAYHSFAGINQSQVQASGDNDTSHQH